MSAVLLLGRRNLRLFMRDRAGVFFSMLSPLILIGLYVLFLGNLQAQSIQEEYPGVPSDHVTAFVTSWVFAGIAMITTLTAALASIAAFVDDGSTGRFQDFLVSPVRRWQLVVGYMASAFVVSAVMSVVVVVVGQVYLGAVFGAAMSWTSFLEAVGYVVLSSAVFSAFCAFIVSFVRTNSAFGALSAIVGTLVGFLAGAYIPPGVLPSGAVNVMNALPFAESAMLIRRPFTEVTVDQLVGSHGSAVASLDETFGMTTSIGSFQVSVAGAVLGLLVLLIVLVALATWRIRSRIR